MSSHLLVSTQRELVATLVARVGSEGRRLVSLRPTPRVPGHKVTPLELLREQEAKEAFEEQESMVSMAKDALALEQLRLDNMLKEKSSSGLEEEGGEEESDGEDSGNEVLVPILHPVDGGKQSLSSGAGEGAGLKPSGGTMGSEVGGEKRGKKVGRVAKPRRALCTLLLSYLSSPATPSSSSSSLAPSHPLSKPPPTTQSRKWFLLSLVFLLYFSFHESAGLVLSGGGLFGAEGGGLGGGAHLRDVLGGPNGQGKQRQQGHRTHPDFPPPNKCVAGPGWVSVRAPLSPPGYPPTAAGGDLSTPFTHPRVLILMLDDRRVPLEMPTWNQAREQYYALSAMRNYLWARSFGYDFAYLHPLKAPNMSAIGGGAGLYRGLMTPACYNSANGRWRGLSWCKVLALWAATSEDPLGGADGTRPRYDLIVFMDSDAVVSNTSAPLAGALAKYHVMKWGNKLESAGVWSEASGWEYAGGGGYAVAEVQYGGRGGVVASEGGPTLFMYSDRQPNDWAVANLGFIIARDSPQLRPLLTTWWEIFPSQDAEKYDFEPHMEQAVMWHMQRGDEYVEGVVKERMSRVVQVNDAPWAPIEKAGWLTHVTSEEDRGSFGESRKVFFRAIHRELNLTEAQWQWHVQDMTRACHIMPIDLEALDLDLVAHDSKSLETLTEQELWAPVVPETLHPGTFNPISPA